jgi:hypothetical protein
MHSCAQTDAFALSNAFSHNDRDVPMLTGSHLYALEEKAVHPPRFYVIEI